MLEAHTRKARVSLAGPSDRPAIYAMRHEVYAKELGQHRATDSQMLSDSLDAFNEYITAKVDGKLVGFISITPPGFGRYSIDKDNPREELPLSFDDGLYELRLLTVAKEHRNSRLAPALMYAAGRWVDERGGTHIVVMGRTEIVSIYLKHGLKPMSRKIKSGAVTFELLETSLQQLRGFVERRHSYYKRLNREVDWALDFPFFKPARCFHGGEFFDAIGTGFDELERRHSIVSADVLDAWFPPSPKVLDAMCEHLPWLMSTSPPTYSDGLRIAIARHRGVGEDNILPSAGSSSLIYLAFRQWLGPSSRVLILDPMYGEYAHILERVIGCKVDRLILPRRNGYAVDLDEFHARAQLGYDLIVLVNPNNPTGRNISRCALEETLARIPVSTRVWIDEAYLDYVGREESLEQFAAKSENTLVCKSMSKVYALSGMRVAYLCGPLRQLSDLIPITPPWAVSLPAQVAAVRALEDEACYLGRYCETRALREQLIAGLRSIGIEEIVPGAANFVMFHLGPLLPSAATVLNEGRKCGVFLRNLSLMGGEVGPSALRIAVKDWQTNERMIGVLERLLHGTNANRHALGNATSIIP